MCDPRDICRRHRFDVFGALTTFAIHPSFCVAQDPALPGSYRGPARGRWRCTYWLSNLWWSGPRYQGLSQAGRVR